MSTPADQVDRVEGPGSPRRPPGISVLLALVPCLYAYSYLVGLWPNEHGRAPWQVVRIREWLNVPLGIGEDFGFLAVAVLLVIGGYEAAGAALAARPARVSAARLILRGYPLFVVAATVSAVLLWVGAHPLTTPSAPRPAMTDYLLNLVLADRILDRVPLVGIGWALAVGAGFSAGLLLARPLLRRAPVLTIAGALVACYVLLVSAAFAGDGEYHRLGVLVAYLPLPVIGSLIRVARDGLLTSWAAGALGVPAVALMLVAETGYREIGQWWHAAGGIYAVLLVLLAVVSGGSRTRSARPLGDTAVVRWLATRAYALVLATGVLGYPVLAPLHLVVRLPLAVLLAMAATMLGAEAGHRWIERPCRRLAERIGAAPPSASVSTSGAEQESVRAGAS